MEENSTTTTITTTATTTAAAAAKNYPKSTSLFNRSATIHTTSTPRKPHHHHLSDRNPKKWYESAKGKVKHLRSFFESSKSISTDNHHSNHPTLSRLRPAKSFSSDLANTWSLLDASPLLLPSAQDRVVIFFTSLRGVRRTFEDCHAVRTIFRCFRVFVDERDVSMDIAYRNELHSLLSTHNNNFGTTLPQVFIKGRHLGGVDIVRQLNESGELRKILHTLPFKDRRFGCDSCGDARFLPCSLCSGSRKLFDEDEGVLKRCLECNENGLIRCPECCL